MAVPPPESWTAGRTPAGGAVANSWWNHLGTAALDSLVTEAWAHNYDLQAAAARLDMAQAQARLAGAPLQPQLSATAGGARRKQNFIGFPLSAEGGAVPRSTTSNYGVDLNLSWEVDLWGRLRAGAAAALADLQATGADLRGAYLSLAAQTARAYFAAVEARRQVELAAATVENYRLSTEQIHHRYQRGLRSSLDLRLGRSNLAAARAALQQRRQQQDRVRRQLELLLGRYPEAALEVEGELPVLAEPVPAGLPADLIGRRPDLAASERRLAASERRLAAARAALYPRISLTASGGRSSSELGDLLDGDFSVWNLVANISQPILQGGRLRAGVDLARAEADQALLVYAGSVLRAYAEVEEALAAEVFLAAQEEALAVAVEEALAARQLAAARYGKGLADLITLLEAQRRAFDAESRLLAVRRQRLDGRVDLHLALGGGFAAPESEPVSTTSAEKLP
jgi:NodT family efflux transporter outer membrane factor (OMF) lipoprotein